MSMSAYRIGDKVYLIHTFQAADPTLPRTLPIGSPSLTLAEARKLSDQIYAAAAKASETHRSPKQETAG